jgi:HMG-box domain
METEMTILHSHEPKKQLGSGATVAEGISRLAEKTERSSRRARTTDLQATEEQGATVMPQHRKINKKRYLAPVVPKRQSEFMLFRLEALADLKARFPGIPWRERVESVSKQWATMSKADKDVSNALFWFEQF